VGKGVVAITISFLPCTLESTERENNFRFFVPSSAALPFPHFFLLIGRGGRGRIVG